MTKRFLAQPMIAVLMMLTPAVTHSAPARSHAALIDPDGNPGGGIPDPTGGGGTCGNPPCAVAVH